MTPVRCSCGAAVIAHDDLDDDQALAAIPHHPLCRHVQPVRPFREQQCA